MAPPTCTRMRIAVGTTEDYEETCYLGKGMYGSVLKARHRATGKTVAIKRLDEPGHSQSEVIREVTFLASCSGNPFVVGFHGVVCAPGSTELRLVMECVGPSLRDVLNRPRHDKTTPPLPEAKVRAVMWQLLTGVKMMHAIHLIHRDIKPDNVLVSTDDESVVKICDLGFAVHMSDVPPYGLAGTRWYMAPEMLLGKTDYDALVDTWSLGCVMAELIDGAVLFKGKDYDDQLCAIIGVLGVPDQWPWFSSTTFATRGLPRWFPKMMQSKLRERLPETVLSEQGFEVLSGLLTWNPDKRLTASAALRHPWFALLRRQGNEHPHRRRCPR